MNEDEKREAIKQLILRKYYKDKLEEIADNTQKKDEKKKTVSDPLAGMKAVVKHFGLQNRLK